MQIRTGLCAHSAVAFALSRDEVLVRSGFVRQLDLAPFLAYDAMIKRDLSIKEEAEEQPCPGLVGLEAIVVAGGRLFDLG